MSWDSYIDSLMILMDAYCRDASRVHCDKDCIIGIDGGSKWTSDAHAEALKPTPQECTNIANCFKPKKFDLFQGNGIFVEKRKYQFLRRKDGKPHAKWYPNRWDRGRS